MACRMYSPSPSPSLPDSDHFSDTSSGIDDAVPYNGEGGEFGPSISRPGSPGIAQLEGQPPEDEAGQDTMTCLWEDCGKVFNHLPSLIDHIHNDHIGVHKSNYTCEWATCTRRGIAQTSRFALISHIRSHTGEKPFTCPRPECDKSFTRSDALAKHMRIQHNISPPLPGRGGNRKRKRDDAPEASSLSHAPEPPSYGYSTFKVEPNAHSDSHTRTHMHSHSHSHSHGGAADDGRLSPLDQHGAYPSRAPSPEYADPDDAEDALPAHLLALTDPATGLVLGRTPAQVRYLLMKAKHRWALEQHEGLVEELRVLRHEERCWRERKDALLDELLRVHFGARAEELAVPLQMASQNHYVYPDDHEEGQT